MSNTIVHHNASIFSHPEGKPVLYSFRRCPYAMRARLALIASGVRVELREIHLRNKPLEFLETSPSATVPCLVASGGVIDESLDVMIWALSQNDPDRWLNMPDEGRDWIERSDGPFKAALDRTKYASRYPDDVPSEHRARGAGFLADLDSQLDVWMFGRPTLADFAILPFVRQFAFIDKDWFDAQPWPKLQSWLRHFLDSAIFDQAMTKLQPWQSGDAPVWFPN